LQIQIPMITAKFSSWFYELPREVGVLSMAWLSPEES
jgi:hypothetical protein